MRAFWSRVRQGLTILHGPAALLPRGLAASSSRGWSLRFTAFWFLLSAFNVGGSVKNVLLVLGVNAVAALRAVHARRRGRAAGAAGQGVRGHRPSGATVAAYSVGQQIAIGVTTFACGFAAIVFIFRFRSFKEVIAAGREARRAPAEPRAPA